MHAHMPTGVTVKRSVEGQDLPSCLNGREPSRLHQASVPAGELHTAVDRVQTAFAKCGLTDEVQTELALFMHLVLVKDLGPQGTNTEGLAVVPVGYASRDVWRDELHLENQ